MKAERFSIALFLFASLSFRCSADFFPDDYDVLDPLSMRHERIRRFIRVFSRKPGPDSKPEWGIGFRGHLKNLLKGGTVKFELKVPHMDKIGKFPFFKELDDLPLEKKLPEDPEPFPDSEVSEEVGKEEGKDFEMLERSDDYGHLINPRLKITEREWP